MNAEGVQDLRTSHHVRRSCTEVQKQKNLDNIVLKHLEGGNNGDSYGQLLNVLIKHTSTFLLILEILMIARSKT